MQTRDLSLEAGEGLYTIEGEFVTESLVICGELTGPDVRLSDHLNSSMRSVVVRPSAVTRLASGGTVDLTDSYASISKEHLLFVVPRREPERPAGQRSPAWRPTQAKRAWAGLGRYSIIGKVHVEAWRDPQLVLRDLEQRQFLPLTECTVAHPDGTTRDVHAVIVNRAHVELLALRESL